MKRWLTPALVGGGTALMVALMMTWSAPTPDGVSWASHRGALAPTAPPASDTATPPDRERSASSAAETPAARAMAWPRVEVIGSAWATEMLPAHAEFRAWTERYRAAHVATRDSLEAEGVRLARTRREALAVLIEEDPRAALAAAIPASVQRGLPASVTALLEEKISGIGRLSVLIALPRDGRSFDDPALIRHSALIGDREFRARVYGGRARQATLEKTSIVGIALDRNLAVSDARFRLVDPSEDHGPPAAAPVPLGDAAASGSPSTAAAPARVEFGGTIHPACCGPHRAAIEHELSALESGALDIEGDRPGPDFDLPRPDPAWTHGPKKLLVIRIDFSDLPGTPRTGTSLVDPAAVDEVINSDGGVRDFFAECSAGKTSLILTPLTGGASPDITPVLRIPTTAAEYSTSGISNRVAAEARTAALAAGYAVDAYDRIAIVFSNLASLPGSIVDRSHAELAGKYFWITGVRDFLTWAHELGHTYGVYHSSYWSVRDGNPLSLAGTRSEYGDMYDVMGAGGAITSHFNPRQKYRLHWIPEEAVLTPTTDGVYRIHRSDGVAPNFALPRAVKLPRDTERDLWLGYRRATNSVTLDNGLSVVLNLRTAGAVIALNLNPPHTNMYEPGLPLFATFTDPTAGVALTPVAQGGTGDNEWLEVFVDFAPYQPRIQWGRNQWFFDEQSGRAQLTLARAGSASGAVSIRYSTQAGTAVSPANFSAQSGVVSWADGDMTDKTIAIALTPDALAEGLESFTVTLSAPVGGMLGGAAAATVTIADAGRRDPTFNVAYLTARAHCVLPLPDGTVLVGGHFVNSTAGSADANRRGLICVGATGVFAGTLGGGPGAFATTGPAGTAGAVLALARQNDGRILAAGDFISYQGTSRPRILRFLADGALDDSFDPGTGADGTIHALLVQPDGKILIGGEFVTYRGAARRHLARLNPDGSLDESFTGPLFAAESNSSVRALQRLPDGKLLVGGRFAFPSGPARSGLCRVESNGALDPSFADGGAGAHVAGFPAASRTVHTVVAQSDGRILVGGDFSGFHGQPRGGLARLAADGTLDPGFAPTCNGTCLTLATQADGRILVGGEFTQFNSEPRSNLVRLTDAGALDARYTSDHAGAVRAFAPWTEERVLLAGDFARLQDATVARIVWSVFSASQRVAAITTQPRSRTVRAGAAVTLAAAADGAAPLTYQWFRDGVALAGATDATLTFSAASNSDTGAYSVAVTNPFGTTTSSVATLNVRPQALRLAGISTRAQVGTGGDIQIGGFAISGTTPKKVIVRASGPALSGYGVPGALQDPVLSLYSGSSLLAQNDDWIAGDAAEFARLGMAAWTSGSRDAALVTTLPPGTYTAQVAGKSGGTGVALVEIYDADDPAAWGQLTGISTRALVGQDSAVLIGGFAIESDAPKHVLIRASGPALLPHGVTGVLVDPVLTIYSGSTAIASNDDWDATLAPDFAAVGMFSWTAGSKDAALALTLPPGAYTAQISGKNGATGVALIEIYEE